MLNEKGVFWAGDNLLEHQYTILLVFLLKIILLTSLYFIGFFFKNIYFVITAIIPTYNRAGFLDRSISSVVNQSLPPGELIIIDDGSSDGTSKLVERQQSRSPIPIVYLYQENRGAAAARNLAIKNSKYPLLAFLDSDDWWQEQKLEKQFFHMSQHPDFLISHTREIWFRKGQRVNQKNKHDPPHGDIFLKSLKMCMVGMSTVLAKKELFEQFGLFDERLPCCEDYDFWLRVGASVSFLLFKEPLTCKNGGREDQLSSIYRMGMDVYRIKSICNLLDNSPLSPMQKKEAVKELKRKCTIYGKGCLKHGRIEEGEKYLQIPNKYSLHIG
jgi:glycosyltransferase involved in cell wall biosynthesis